VRWKSRKITEAHLAPATRARQRYRHGGRGSIATTRCTPVWPAWGSGSRAAGRDLTPHALMNTLAYRSSLFSLRCTGSCLPDPGRSRHRSGPHPRPVGQLPQLATIAGKLGDGPGPAPMRPRPPALLTPQPAGDSPRRPSRRPRTGTGAGDLGRPGRDGRSSAAPADGRAPLLRSAAPNSTPGLGAGSHVDGRPRSGAWCGRPPPGVRSCLSNTTRCCARSPSAPARFRDGRLVDSIPPPSLSNRTLKGATACRPATPRVLLRPGERAGAGYG
jgi:hypothetical protein